MNIHDLDKSTPKVDDPISEADDHIRGIKQALVDTFPHFNAAFNYSFSTINKIFNNIYVDPTTFNVKFVNSNYQYSEDTLDKKLFIDKNGIVKYTLPLVPIGSIIKTVLTITQMNNLYGVGVFQHIHSSVNISASALNIWASGQIPASPDLYINDDTSKTYASRFIRQAVDDFSAGDPMPMKIGAPVDGLVASKTDPGLHKHPIKHEHKVYGSSYGFEAETFAATTYTVHSFTTDYTIGDPYHPTTADVTKTLTDYETHKHTVKTLTGDVETRPKHITLHHYLRVN